MAIRSAEEIITHARISLLQDKPFFGHLACGLIVCESAFVPTMGVTADRRLLFNREFVENLSNLDATAIIAHEVMHVVQGCMERFPTGGIFPIWNLAADQVINTMLIDAGISGDTEFQKAIPSEIQVICRNKITEVRYNELLQENKNEDPDCEACKENREGVESSDEGGGGGSDEKEGESTGEGDENSDAGGDGKETKGHGHGGNNCNGHSKKKHTCNNPLKCISSSLMNEKNMTPKQINELRQLVVSAAASAQARGKGDVPGQILDMLTEISKPSVNWREVVRRTAARIYAGKANWKKNSRRGSGIGARLPGRRPEVRGAAIAIDTSGSISNETISQFVSECAGIIVQCGCPFLTIMFHDTEVYYMEEFTKESLTKIKVQRGGTSHIDVFQKLDEMKVTPTMLVCFTDLESAFPDRGPDIPVIWGHPEETAIDPGFGRKIRVQLTAK